MDITITASKAELDVPFPNFAARAMVILEQRYDEAKAAAIAAAKDEDVIVTITTTKVKRP